MNATERAMKHVRWLWQLEEWRRMLRDLPALAEKRRVLARVVQARRANG